MNAGKLSLCSDTPFSRWPARLCRAGFLFFRDNYYIILYYDFTNNYTMLDSLCLEVCSF